MTFFRTISPIFFLLLLVGCNPVNIDFDLPPYQSQLVVECYLEDGKTPKVLVTQSIPYFEPPDTLPLVTHALVTLSHGTIIDTLTLGPSIWYESKDTVHREDTGPWILTVIDTKGRKARATTQFLPIVPIDSLSYNRDSANKARVLVYWNDPAGVANQYRITAVGRRSEKTWSIEISDDIFDGLQATWPTKAKFAKENVDIRLYNIDSDYFSFLTSIWNAGLSSDGPITEPTEIYSNIQGGLGIFTALSFSTMTVNTRN